MEFIPLLEQLGLSHTQSRIIDLLYRRGISRASTIAELLGIKRGAAYNALAELATDGLVVVDESPGRVALYGPVHPDKLRTLVESKRKQLDLVDETLSIQSGAMLSQFNQHVGLPNVQMIEGLAGVRQVLWDSLDAESPVLTYLDLATMLTYFPDLQAEYVVERERRAITKRNLVVNTPEARTFMKRHLNGFVDARVIDYAPVHLHAAMLIYDNKCTYITVSDKLLLGVIVEDARIAEMHRFLFQALYEHSLMAQKVVGV